MPFLRHSEVGSTTIWLRIYWQTGAHEVKVHFSCAPLGKTCTKVSSASSGRFTCSQADLYAAPCQQVFFQWQDQAQTRNVQPFPEGVSKQRRSPGSNHPEPSLLH